MTPRDVEKMIGAIVRRLDSEARDEPWLACRPPCQLAKLAAVGKRSREAISSGLDPRVMCPACSLREALAIAESNAGDLS